MQQRLTRIEALCLTILLLLIIGMSIIYFQTPPHGPIFICLTILILFSYIKKFPWKETEKGIIEGIRYGIIPIIIFILIGILISVWVASGTIPTLIAYGFKIISKDYFLITVFVLTAIVGTSIGSAFTTAATLGVAFIGIGGVFGFPLPLIAGAVISGAFFGDKMSPLSDTTNLASAVAKVDLFEHIRHMMWTTIPAFFITLIIYWILGARFEIEELSNMNGFLMDLQNNTFIHWVTLLPIVILFVLAFIRFSAIPTLLLGILSGIILIILFQPGISVSELFSIIQDGYKIDTGNEQLNSLLNRGGIQSMMWSVSLILLSLSMGGLLTKLGVIAKLLEMMESLLVTTGRLIATTTVSALSINVLLGEQYLSIILSGNVFSKKYDQLGVNRKNLSRSLEDGGTLINPLIPWGVSGVFLTSVLGVATLDYLPYAFFCLICPVISIVFGFAGIGLAKEK
ncbi:Na+/H+ antiporter NhaC [Fredinandcohnia quinoae]|uniref:Na+/H+ antiporter NhaC n=1 Tax=Fredinandcohnia quinoae TaxID=2918902 RepID=A0AAW5E3N3_9BACI|nr:Na+/H+ antiporter NhaC [Fredinandcohnia sp. SECRCQ15]MCH1627542.1 Na+/H+ antiporter NhaC [Fredinandcohnia sp. SECRCQ15]